MRWWQLVTSRCQPLIFFLISHVNSAQRWPRLIFQGAQSCCQWNLLRAAALSSDSRHSGPYLALSGPFTSISLTQLETLVGEMHFSLSMTYPTCPCGTFPAQLQQIFLVSQRQDVLGVEWCLYSGLGLCTGRTCFLTAALLGPQRK